MIKIASFFNTELNNFDNMVDWFYASTTGRFNFLGTSMIYFEKEDVALFKLTWFGD